MARFDTVEVDGSPMCVCIAAPDGAEPHPAVVVMCHIGGPDAFTGDRVEAGFRPAGIACEFHRCEGADHAFQNFTNPERHHPEAAEDAWNRTLRFLGEHLA